MLFNIDNLLVNHSNQLSYRRIYSCSQCYSLTSTERLSIYWFIFVLHC